MDKIITFILNVCDCLQIITNELFTLILQPIYTLIRIIVQCCSVFNYEVFPEEEEHDNKNELNNHKIGFIK
jgi:hypothetical protein